MTSPFTIPPSILPRTSQNTLRVLGREERNIDLIEPLLKLRGRRVLVTGASGSIGSALVPVLRRGGVSVIPTDIELDHGPWGTQFMDVRDFDQVLETVNLVDADLIVHLAADKHAPAGELHPSSTCQVNIDGTKNVIDTGRKVVFASSCKSADPETVYGASKLVGERMTMNSGGTVARFYNVVETRGNVFDIWQRAGADAAPWITNCSRYFVSLREALSLIVWSCVLDAGRYTIDPGAPRRMTRVAKALFPGQEIERRAARRGDRLVEPRHAASEWIEDTEIDWIDRIVSAHDPQPSSGVVTASMFNTFTANGASSTTNFNVRWAA